MIEPVDHRHDRGGQEHPEGHPEEREREPEHERLGAVGEEDADQDAEERQRGQPVLELHANTSRARSATSTCRRVPVASARSSMTKRGWWCGYSPPAPMKA